MPPRPPNRSPAVSQGVVLGVAVLAIAAALSYANSLCGALQFDDQNVIPRLTRLPMTWETAWTTLRHGGLRGLGSLTFVVDGWIGGRNLTGLHATNIAIHLAAGLILFGLVRRTLELPGIAPALQARALPLAFAVALIWIVHPLQTQAVTYLVQRYESLMALFYLLALYATARSQESARPALWQALTVLSMWLGLLSKEVMATAPLAVLIFDRVYLSTTWRDVWNQRRWMYLGLALPMILGAIILAPLVFSRSASLSVGLGVRSVSPAEYAASQPGVILHYLQLAVWPQDLCLDYEWPVARDWASIWPAALILCILLGGIAWAWWRWPKVAYVATLFFLILAPTSSVVPIKDLAFEHRMYLPLAVVVVLVVLALDAALQFLLSRFAASPSLKKLVPLTLLAIVAIALAARTMIRNEDYRSPIALWMSTLRVRPQNARALHNLMEELDQVGRVDEAYAIGEHVVELNQLRNDPTAEQHLFLGERYALHQRWSEAIPHFETAIAQSEQVADLSPAHREQLAEAHISLGAAFLLTQQPEQARLNLQQALALVPDSEPAKQMLSQLRLDQPATRRGIVNE